MNKIYMDNAATTAVAPSVLEKMLPYFTQVYGNASSIHATGREAHKVIDEARRQVAAAIGCAPNEVYFTGSGSESDNWAINGAAFARQKKGNHIITSSIEHHAVLHTCQWLEKHGFEVTYLPVDEYGQVSPEEVEKAEEAGLICASMGPRILRCETAPLCAVSAIMLYSGNL